MIPYSSITVAEAIHECKAKLSKFDTASALDDKAIFRFLESARRELFARFLPFKDYAFVREVAIADGDPVPDEFIKVCTIRAKSSTATEYRECRRASIKELWTLGNATRPHSWVNSTESYPVYALYGSSDPAEERMCVHLRPTTVSGFMEYYAAPGDLPRDANNDFIGSSLLAVPYEYENYLINSTLLRCYVRIGEVAEVRSMVEKMAVERFKLNANSTAASVTTGINMESLPNPEPSQTPSVLPTSS